MGKEELISEILRILEEATKQELGEIYSLVLHYISL